MFISYTTVLGESHFILAGGGNRYLLSSHRNPIIKKIISKHICKSMIIKDNLTEEEAYLLERQVKLDLLLEGHPIV